MSTTMRFVILGDERDGSRAFDRFARSVDKSSTAVGRSQAALAKQQKQQDITGNSLGGLTAHVTGFGDAMTVASPKATLFARGLSAVNIATGIAEPAMAGLIVAAGGLAAAYSAAAAGAIAYKVALTPLLAEVKNVAGAQAKLAAARTQAQQQYKLALASGTSAASAATARTTALAKAQQAYTTAVKDTPAPVKAMAKELKTVQDSYKNWANSLARPVLAPLQHGLTLVKPALKEITPLVLAGARAIGTLEQQFARTVKGGGLERLVSDVLPHVRPAILDLGHSIGNIAVGIGGIIRAFLPMADRVGGGVVKLTALFRQWAVSLPSHSGFQALMNMFKTETPLVVNVLKNLAQIIKNVAAATIGLASPANSKALLQILTPLSQIMVQLTANAGLVRAVLYFTLLQGSLKRVSGAVNSLRGGVAFLGGSYGSLLKTAAVLGRFRDGFGSAGAAASAFSGKAGTLGGVLGKLTGLSAGARAAIAGLAGPVAGGALAIGAMVAILIKWNGGITAVTDKLAKQDKATGFNIEGYRRLAAQTDATQFSQSKMGDAIRNSVPAFRSAREGAVAYSQTVGQVRQAHEQAASSAENLASRLSTLQQSYGLTRAQAERLAGKAGVTAEQIAATGDAGDEAFRKVVAYAGGMGSAWVKSQRLTASQNALKTSLDKVTSSLLASQGTLLGWQQAQQSALDAIKASNTGLRGQSSAALDARQSLLQSTQAAIDHARAQEDQKNGMKRATDTIKEQIRFLQQHGEHSKFATDEIHALRDALKEIRDKHAHLTVNAEGHYSVAVGGGNRIRNQWTGGRIRGPGGPTDDKAGLYALSNNEWVIRANAAARYGDRAMSAVNRGTATILHRGNGMAAGGKAVTGSYSDGARGLGRFEVREYDATLKAVEDATAAAAAKVIRTGGGWGRGAGRKLVNFLRPFVHRVPYVWGGTTPNGWDCSGMTQYGLRHAVGVSSPRTSEQQFAWVRRTRDQVGALAFFVGAGGPPPGHVGVSMGNGLMINAAGTLSGTTISGTGGSMGFGVPPGPPGMAGGGKVKHAPDPQRRKWLAQLARDVKVLEQLRKHARRRRKVLRHAVEIDQLWFLTHPNVKRGGIGWNEHEKALRNDRRRLSGFNKREGDKEGILARKIALLRDLTGFPAGLKYGGPGVPGPDPGAGDGGGDTGGGDTGGGTTAPSGPPPIPPPPMPAWMIAAGLGGAGAGAAGFAGFAGMTMQQGWRGFPYMGDPIAGRASRPAPGGGGTSGPASLAEVIDAIRAMHGDVVRATRSVAPGVALGFDESMSGMTARVAGRIR